MRTVQPDLVCTKHSSISVGASGNLRPRAAIFERHVAKRRDRDVRGTLVSHTDMIPPRLPARAGRTGGVPDVLPVVVLSCLLVALAAPNEAGRPWVVLVLSSALALAVAPRSSIVAAYLAQAAVFFGLTSLLRTSPIPSGVYGAVVVWILGVAGGALAVRHRTVPAQYFKALSPLTWKHSAAVAGSVGVHAALVLTHQVGYSAQISTGRTTPTGILGAISGLAAVLSAAYFATALKTGSHRTMATCFVLIEASVLSLAGFRGQGVAYVVAILVSFFVLRSRNTRWSLPRLVALAVACLALFAMLFSLGSAVRSQQASTLGVTSEGTREVFGIDALKAISRRLDMAESLASGYRYRDDAVVRDRLAWKDQALAFVPRVLWPEKPDANYGQRVSVYVYGLPFGASSSTITTIGDVLLNSNFLGVATVAWAWGFLISRVETWARGDRVTSPVIVTAVALSVLNFEQPLLLTIAGTLKLVLLASLVWWVCGRSTHGKPENPDRHQLSEASRL